MSDQTPSTPDNAGMTKEPETPTTTRKLFPDLLEPESPGTEVEKPKEGGTEPVVEPPKPEGEQSLDEFLAEQFLDKKLKTKVDGQEMVVSLRDVIKGYQTDQHLTKKGQKLAQKEQEIEEKLQEALKTAINKPIEKPGEEEDDPFLDLVKPHIAPLLGELKTVKEQLNVLASLVEPMRYQENLKKVDATLKARGHDDFMQYVPRIENQITEVASIDVGEANRLNTPQGYIELFLDLKLKDLNVRPQTPTPTPPKTPESPKIPLVEGSTGVGTGSNDDWLVQYNEARAEAMRTGDWTKVLKLKGVI